MSAKDKNEAVSSSPNSASAAKPVCGKSRRSARSRSYARHSPSPRSTPCAKVSACAETGISISRTAGRKKPPRGISSSYEIASTLPSTKTCPPSIDSCCRCSPCPRMDIGPRVEVSKISVSSKLSTSRTPVMERRLRESSVSRCGCWARFVSISACCMVSSFLLSGYAGFSLHIYAGRTGLCSFFMFRFRGTWLLRRPCAQPRPRRVPRP